MVALANLRAKMRGVYKIDVSSLILKLILFLLFNRSLLFRVQLTGMHFTLCGEYFFEKISKIYCKNEPFVTPQILGKFLVDEILFKEDIRSIISHEITSLFLNLFQNFKFLLK
jgi:hypothetical protein